MSIPMPSAWNGRRVFVTGCSGFLGRWVVGRLCDRGASVIGLTRRPFDVDAALRQRNNRVTLVEGDVADFAVLARALAEFQIDTVLHLAAQTQVPLARRAPADTFEANIRGTWNVLECARRSSSPVGVVFASSEAVYGDSSAVPYCEKLPLASVEPYGASKGCGEWLCRTYHRTYGLAVAMVRSTNIYGGGDLNFERLIPGTIRAILRGEPPELRGDGRSRRDYLYAGDAADAFLAVAAALRDPQVAGESFNIGAGNPLTSLEVVEAILSLTGRHDLSPRILGTRADGVPIKYSSSEKIRNLLGWSPQMSLMGGLGETIEWYRAMWHASSSAVIE